LPVGLVYRPEFLTAVEEAALLETIATLPLAPATLQVVRSEATNPGLRRKLRLRRRAAPPRATDTEFLLPLRAKVAAWVGVPATDFTHGLVSRVSARHGARLASRRAEFRARRGRLARHADTHPVPAVSAAKEPA
jgi:hypothetical protein